MRLGIAIAIVSAGGFAVAGVWAAVSLIINPDAILWTNRFLPQWGQLPTAVRYPPQTLADIEKEIAEEGLTMGDPLAFDLGLVVPLQKYRNDCECHSTTILRVYHQAETLPLRSPVYNLMQEISVPELSEYFVLEPLINKQLARSGGIGSVPLTTLTSLDHDSVSGIWINLSHVQKRGNINLAYGQVFRYSPESKSLQNMMRWTSPVGEMPQWRKITGGEAPDLVVNQTIGLEPKLIVHQLRTQPSLNTTTLAKISLDEPPAPHQSLAAYRQALMLSQKGLWSPAFKKLKAVQADIPAEEWSSLAEAQLNVITLHSEITQSQCEQGWASPSQQILACVIDGDWTKSLETFKAANSQVIAQEITPLLKNDSGRIAERLEAALEVQQGGTPVQAWGTLLRAVKDNRESATNWLKSLSSYSANTQPEIDAVLDQWEFAIAQLAPRKLMMTQIVGIAEPIPADKITAADWLQPNGEDTLAQASPSQAWYQVRVTTFYDGQYWLNSPFNLPLSSFAPEKQLWRHLGLDLDSQMQLRVWQEGKQVSTTASVKAAQIKEGRLHLLLLGSAIDSARPSLAFSTPALRWQQPSSIRVNSLYTSEPKKVETLLPILWKQVHSRRPEASESVPELTELLEAMGNWTLQRIDLTGNEKLETVIQLYQNSEGELSPFVPNSTNSAPQTLILTEEGKIIYNELTQNSSSFLVSFANLGSTPLTNLVINVGNDYQFKRWSPSQQRFE